jgi:hypothetical protein
VRPSCHDAVESQISSAFPLHFRLSGMHVPEQAPPLHAPAQVVFETHMPLSSQSTGTRPSHFPVPGTHSPVHAPSWHTKAQVSMRVVVTRSTPHWMESLP